MARIDYDSIASAYHAGRAASIETLEPWRAALARHFPTGRQLRVLDVGSGTGIWSSALARWFDAHVIGMEPAGGMLEEAQASSSHARIAYVGGVAERIPLRDHSCDRAWLSAVIHHLGDLPCCIRELRRVLRPGSTVFVRSYFPDREKDLAHFPFFPGAKQVADTFPTTDATVEAFASVGFELEDLQDIPQVVAPSLVALAARVRRMRHADSTFARLTDTEFDAGLEALEREAGRQQRPAPVVYHFDLLVLAG